LNVAHSIAQRNSQENRVKYLAHPEDFVVLEPSLRQPTANRCTFLMSARMAVHAIYNAGSAQGAPHVKMSTLKDIEEKCGGKPGDPIAFNDEEHELLLNAFSDPDPKVFTAAWAFSSDSHVDALRNASDKKPETKANGKTEELQELAKKSPGPETAAS
jgi:hypothetical protein